jgi:hypothetical protein
MSEGDLGQTPPGFREAKEQQPKKETVPKSANEKQVSKVPKNNEKRGLESGQTKAILRSLNEQERLMKNILKNIDRESKEVSNIQVQIARLEKYSLATDKTFREMVTFIHNKGWKKKKNK